MLVAGDQFLNVALKPIGLGSGHPDETLSAFWGRGGGGPVARLIMRGLDKLDKDHGFDAIERKPGEETEEPHHMGGYETKRTIEDAALDLALQRADVDDYAMGQAESAAKRQRLREAARDKAQGDVK